LFVVLLNKETSSAIPPGRLSPARGTPSACKSKATPAFLRNADNSVSSLAGIPNIFLIASTN